MEGRSASAQPPSHASTRSRSTVGGEVLCSRSTGQLEAGQPLLVCNPAAPIERRVVVPARPLQELGPGRLVDRTAPVARTLASFEAANPLGRVQGQEHHRIATSQDIVTPSEHRAGQDPRLSGKEEPLHERDPFGRGSLLDIRRIARYPEVVIRVSVWNGPVVGHGSCQCRRAGAAGAHHVKPATSHRLSISTPTPVQQSNTDQQMSFRNRWSSSTSSRIASGSWSRCHWHSRRPAASLSPSGPAARAALIA